MAPTVAGLTPDLTERATRARDWASGSRADAGRSALDGRQDVGGRPLKFLPLPLAVTIGPLNPWRRSWVSLADGLHVENEPPWRMVLPEDKTAA